MREVAPGDNIFSFRDTRIAALGIARSYCYESPKPTEFGTAGSYWEAIGWKIDVSFRELDNRIHPKSHIGEPSALAMPAGVRNIPTPMTSPTTRATAEPSRRCRPSSTCVAKVLLCR